MTPSASPSFSSVDSSHRSHVPKAVEREGSAPAATSPDLGCHPQAGSNWPRALDMDWAGLLQKIGNHLERYGKLFISDTMVLARRMYIRVMPTVYSRVKTSECVGCKVKGRKYRRCRKSDCLGNLNSSSHMHMHVVTALIAQRRAVAPSPVTLAACLLFARGNRAPKYTWRSGCYSASLLNPLFISLWRNVWSNY